MRRGAVRAGKSEELQEIVMEHVVPLYDLRTRRKGYEVSAMKVLMDLAGLKGGPIRPPLVEVVDADRPELEAILAGWKQFL